MTSKQLYQDIASLFLLIVILSGCKQPKSVEPLYSFFTAGHTYGNPNNPQFGLYPPFTDFFETLNKNPKMELGFLTGDVVNQSTPEYWDAAQADINKLHMPVFIAPGNHDIGDEFLDRFEKYYYSFTHKEDLFIVLTPGLFYWNIAGEQLAFLKTELETHSSKVSNIFLILHELIWWSPNNEYKDIRINYKPHYPGKNNYNNVIKPLLRSYPNNITIYAGDLGATSQVSSVMHDQYDNITLIGSGMGGGIKDNFIITHVFKDSISYELIAINGEHPGKMGQLKDYSISK